MRSKTIDLTTMVYGKVPPHDKETEEVILGALMLDINSIPICMTRCFPEIFYYEHHQRVFSAIGKLYDRNQPIDILTVIDQLKKDESLEIVGGAYAVTRLTNSVVSGANIESHLLHL